MSSSIPASFLTMELMVFGLFGWAVWTAAKRGRFDLITLLAASMFGFAIEYLFSTPFQEFPAWLQWLLWNQRNDSGDSYDYGHFLVVIAGVPLWVSVGWGTIIYASLCTSERLGFSFWLVPLADGLLAASVDLALDPIAQALGYWSWTFDHTGLTSMFGVPLDNFLGWLMIVGGLSFTIRVAAKVAARWNDALWVEVGGAFIAILVALVFAMALQGLFDFLYARITPAGTFMLIFGTVGLVTIAQLPWLRRDQPIDPFALGVVGSMQLMLLLMMFATGVLETLPALFGFQPLLAIASMLAFAWPSLEQLRRLSAHRQPLTASGTP